MAAARWFVFACGFLAFAAWARQWTVARRGRSEAGRVVNPAWRAGSLLQFGGIVALLLWPSPHPSGLPIWVYAGASAIALGSAALGARAAMDIGRQMRVQAVVTAEHRLITSGAYSILRHPMYAAAFGLLVAAVLVFTHPAALVVAGSLFVAGTEIRIRAEDKLLASHFGAAHDDYRRRVKAYLPGIR